MKLKTFILPLLCLAFGLRANAQANGPVQTFTWDKPYAVERIKAPRNRQVRKMLEAVGHQVVSLKRVEFGPVSLGDLPRGQWRRLTEREVEKLKAIQ